jgi:hypothetical protein
MQSSEWASWVQAVGSIGAIGIAIYIASSQSREAKVDARRRELSERLVRIQTAYQLTSAVAGAAMVAHIKEAPWMSDGKKTSRYERFSAISRFGEALMQAPLFDLGDIDAITYIVQISWLVERMNARIEQDHPQPWDEESNVVLKTALAKFDTILTRVQAELTNVG